MNNTGRELLGKHIYDILSPSSSRVMTIGNTSNDAYITFYSCNMPIERGYQMGLCNETFVINNNYNTTRVGINTLTARNTLDINGLLSTNSITTYQSNINLTNTTLSNIDNLFLNGISHYKNKPLNITWTNVTSNYETTDIYNMSKIGIGSTSPQYDVDVVGSINFTDYIYHNGTEYRESQFQFLRDSSNTMLSNIYYINNVGIGTDTSNELVRYRLYVFGDVAIDGKIYANDYVSYRGAAANSYREFPIYDINPNNENKLVVTNDTNDINTVIYDFTVRAGRYLVFVNLPFINRSPYIFIDNQNWAEIVLYQGAVSSYTKDSAIVSKVPLEIREINKRNTQTVEFFVQADADQQYTIAVRGKGHTLEIGGISFVNDLPVLEIDSLLRVFPIKGIGLDDSFSVRKALQVTPIRYQTILLENTSNFVFTTEGNYTATASNVDVFINGLKYVHYNDNKKDYDITYQYNLQNNTTIFDIQLTESAQKNDVIDIAIWPYVTADTLYVSGYYYQQVNNFPTQWLNINTNKGIRYPRDVVIDGNLIVRGNIVGGCNTDEFVAGLPAGDLTITSNVVGTLNIIDGSVTTSKLGRFAVTGDRLSDYSVDPAKLLFKDRVVVVGCNLNEVIITSNELPRQRGLYVDGDLFIKGIAQASVFAGSSEGIVDGGVTTIKLANQAVTFPKIAPYSLSNSLIPDNAIATRNIQDLSITTNKLNNRSVTSEKIANNTILRSNISVGAISSNEIANHSILTNNLSLITGNVGIGILSTRATAKLHVFGDTIINGNIFTQSNLSFNIGNATNRFDTIFMRQLNLNNLLIKPNTDPFNPTIEISDSIGNPVKASFGDLFTCNIGIGTTTPLGGLDVNNGNVIIRNGSIGIGTTSIRQNVTIDANQDPNSRLLINNIGIGTLFNIERVSIFGGGLYINSNETFFVFRNGNVGIGTGVAAAKLHVVNDNVLFDNNNISLNQSSLTVTDGSISISKEFQTAIDVVGNIKVNGNITSCNISAFSSDNDVGTLELPYATVYTRQLTLMDSTSNTTVLKQSADEIYAGGDTYTSNYSYNALGQSYTPIINNLTNNLYVSGSLNFYNYFPFRNIVINGDMKINQRYPGSNNFIRSTTPFPRTYTLDRHETRVINSTAMLNISQSNVSFFNSLFAMACRVGITTSTLSSTANHILFSHKIENQLVNNLQWGTSNALPLTISFDLLSTADHTFYLSIHNFDRSRSLVRDIIVTASTIPRRYTYTISGDLYGNWRNNIFDSDTGINICINTGIGSSFVSALENTWRNGTFYGRASSTGFLNTVNRTFLITNVQAEAGYMATVYEQRPIVTELQLCQRYYEKSYNMYVLPGASSREGIQYLPLSSDTAISWTGLTVPFKTPKRNVNWTGVHYSANGTAGRLSYRETNGQFFDYTTTGYPAPQPSSNTVFGNRGENNFSLNFQITNITTKIFAFHWIVDAEL
jgi:hypothetical protein